MTISLSNLLQYKNIEVLTRYEKDYAANKLNSTEAFVELMKYFWLNDKHAKELGYSPESKDLQFTCYIHKEMSEIDDMWHTFLLYTKDYMSFCALYFGRYLHHTPLNPTIEPDKIKFEEELEIYLSYIYDNLGDETLNKWFAELLTI